VGKLRLVSLVLIVSLLGGVAWQRTLAQESEKYFDQTGHRVSGEFWVAYNKVSNGLQLYGYPITEAYQDPTTRLMVQYFQKARFEFDASDPENGVQITPLGTYLYQPGEPADLPGNSGPCRTFPPKDFKVCYSFLDFYQANGGMLQFGAPISRDQLRVQYFEKARFEWRPDMPARQRVVLSNLGEQYFYAHGENVTRLLPNKDGVNIIRGILTLKVHAYPMKAVTGKGGSQTVYVIVQDQRLLPVANARISVQVQMPSGEVSRFESSTLTNEQGIAQVTFPFATASVGLAQVVVTVNHDNLQTQTITSFRVWW
jgi:hypothetical protein